MSEIVESVKLILQNGTKGELTQSWISKTEKKTII